MVYIDVTYKQGASFLKEVPSENTTFSYMNLASLPVSNAGGMLNLTA